MRPAGRHPRAGEIAAGAAAGAAVVWAVVRAVREPGLDPAFLATMLLTLGGMIVGAIGALAAPFAAVRLGKWWRWRRLAAAEARFFAAPHCLKCGYPVHPRTDGDDDACVCPECGGRIHPYVARRVRELARRRETGQPPSPPSSTPFARKGSFLKFLRRWS